MIISFVLGMHFHTITKWLNNLTGNAVFTHNFLLFSVGTFIIILLILLQKYYPRNAKILILVFKKSFIFRKVLLPQFIKKVIKLLKKFWQKYKPNMRVNFRLCVLLFMFIRVERDWLEAFRRVRLIKVGNLLLTMIALYLSIQKSKRFYNFILHVHTHTRDIRQQLQIPLCFSYFTCYVISN